MSYDPKQHMTPDTVKKVEHIEAMTDEAILACISFNKEGGFDYEHPAFLELRFALTPSDQYINYSWISSQLAEELYKRDVYDADQMDRITNE